MNLKSILRISILYYSIFLQLLCLYRIFTSLVGRTSLSTQGISKHGEEFATEIFSDLIMNISVNTLPEDAHPNKFYMVLIDALRPDFINSKDTPFIWSSLKSKDLDRTATTVTVKVHSPTVTLPRIKSILTGSVPSYQDVITNFHTTRLEEDNLIWKFKQSGRNICFYGDDTWLKLFHGDLYFTRYEGVHSFFVTDWIEVDDNVTRNLYREFTHDLQPECQFTILHYLGLDHIGHVHGPKSALINKKLKEMDAIVEHIYTNAENNSLILICGDHGMANIGGHGGDSWEETHTTLVAITNAKRNPKFYSSSSENDMVYQTDLAPTLAVLFGLDIPKPSIGTLIPNILSFYFSPEHTIQSYHKNFVHLLSKLDPVEHKNRIQTYFDDLNDTIYYNEAENLHLDKIIKKYTHINQDLTNILSEELAGERDLFQMILSIGILAQVVLILIIFEGDDFYRNIESVSVLNNLIAAFVCTLLCFVFVSLDMGLLVLNAFILYQIEGFRWDMISKSKMDFFPALVIYFASSLIEEEHYVRYFLWTSIIFYVVTIAPNFVNKSKTNFSKFSNVIFLLLIHRLTSVLNQTGQKWSEEVDINDVISDYKCVELVSCLSVCVLLILAKKSSVLFKCSVCYILVLKLFLFWNQSTSSVLVLGVQLGYVFIVMTALYEYWIVSNPFFLFNTCVLFCILLHKLINYTVIASVVLQLKLLHSIVKPYYSITKDVNNKADTIPYYVISLYSWYSFACFFYQGNSNNITTIEINIGYIGLESYNSFIIGVLIFFYTTSCPFLVYSFILSDDIITLSSKSSIVHAVVKTNAIECFVYSMAICMFRSHLFIWSVFVPKLFYMIGWTVFRTIVLTLFQFKLYKCI